MIDFFITLPYGHFEQSVQQSYIAKGEEKGFKEPTTYTTLLSKSIVAKHYYSTDTDFSRTYYGQKVAH